ncbi:MAG: spore germination protein [Desulfotomaculum sp.]|nr:spore germination protein [Desulfotomaculum sp.]
MKFFSYLKRGKNSLRSNKQAAQLLQDKISKDLNYNLTIIEKLFTKTPDLIIRRFYLNQTGQPAALVYIEGLTDKLAINEHILYPLMHEDNFGKNTGEPAAAIGRTKKAVLWNDIVNYLLMGYSVLLIDGRESAVLYDTQGWPQRAIEEPQTESTIKGAHQGFIETSKQNIALIRRYIPNRELKMKEFIVGRRSKTLVTMLYLADVAHPEVLKEMEKRIQRLDVDSIINTGELAEFIEDNSFSIFPQFQISERPDAVASHILQGRCALVVDVSPGVLVGPMTFTSFFQTVDDYSTRWISASFLRSLRFLSLFIALFLPSLYIAQVSFHYELLPLNLIMSVGESRVKVPLPPIVEAFMMEIFLEMLRESGLRLPTPIGQAVGIVGGIVIGQAAVQAGIVSNIMVIVVSLTAIASFIIPSMDMSAAIRLLRFPIMVLSALLGMLGIVLGMMAIIAHIISLESLKTPYGAPFAPLKVSDFRDTIIRFPLWSIDKRPFTARPVQRKKLNWKGKNKKSK